MTGEIRVAGKTVSDPVGVWKKYSRDLSGTLTGYDRAGVHGDPNDVSNDLVTATRIINSRISKKEATEIVGRLAGHRDLLRAIPVNADLADADPAENGGLYDDMTALYEALKGPNVKDGKVSKVLHLKRPGLYPILDSRLQRLYKCAATAAAKNYPQRPFRRMYWAAIRYDLIDNRDALKALRAEISDDPRLSERTDLRLLDILTWDLAG
jgi:hypothetical protein